MKKKMNQKRVVAGAIGLLCVAALLSGCGARTNAPAEETKTAEETQAQDLVIETQDRTAEQAEGQTQEKGADWCRLDEKTGAVSVRLPAGVGTGYSWSYTISGPEDADSLELMTRQFAYNDKGKNEDGLSGVWIADFVGVPSEAGMTATVTFRYSRGEKLCDVRCMEVKSDKDGRITSVAPASVMETADLKGAAEGGEPDIADNGELTLDAILEKNTLFAILTDHSSVTYSIDYLDGNDQPESSIRSEYIMYEGKLWYESVNSSTEGYETKSCGYTGDGVPGAYYSYSPTDGAKFMELYPAGEYETFISELWPLNNWLWEKDYEGRKRTVKDQGFQDGALIMEVKTEHPDFPRQESLLYIDPETGLIVSLETSSYDESGKPFLVTKIHFSYDEPFLPEAEAQGMITGAENPCSLKLTITDSRTGDTETQEFKVARDAEVSFRSKQEHGAYYDAAHTEPAGLFDVSGDICEVYAVIGAEE